MEKIKLAKYIGIILVSILALQGIQDDLSHYSNSSQMAPLVEENSNKMVEMPDIVEESKETSTTEVVNNQLVIAMEKDTSNNAFSNTENSTQTDAFKVNEVSVTAINTGSKETTTPQTNNVNTGGINKNMVHVEESSSKDNVSTSQIELLLQKSDDQSSENQNTSEPTVDDYGNILVEFGKPYTFSLTSETDEVRFRIPRTHSSTTRVRIEHEYIDNPVNFWWGLLYKNWYGPLDNAGFIAVSGIDEVTEEDLCTGETGDDGYFYSFHVNVCSEYSSKPLTITFMQDSKSENDTSASQKESLPQKSDDRSSENQNTSELAVDDYGNILVEFGKPYTFSFTPESNEVWFRIPRSHGSTTQVRIEHEYIEDTRDLWHCCLYRYGDTKGFFVVRGIDEITEGEFDTYYSDEEYYKVRVCVGSDYSSKPITITFSRE